MNEDIGTAIGGFIIGALITAAIAADGDRFTTWAFGIFFFVLSSALLAGGIYNAVTY